VGTERPEGQLVSNRLKLTLFKFAPTAILIAVFLLGSSESQKIHRG
jgi:hypothetical protein